MNNTRKKAASNAILYSNFVKYDELNKYFDNIKLYNDNLYLFIDINMFRSVYTESNDNPTAMKVAVGILNAVAHYRHYFKTKFKNINEIYTFIVSDYDCVDTYEHNIYKIISNITPFLPDTFYINSNINYPIPVSILRLVYDLLLQNGTVNDIITVSKNPLAYQLPSLLNMYINTRFYKVEDDKLFQNHLIMPHRYKEPDFINKDNALYEFFIKSRGLKDPNTIIKCNNLNPLLLALIISYTGDKRLKMSSVCKVREAMSSIELHISNHEILNGINSEETLSHILLEDSWFHIGKYDGIYKTDNGSSVLYDRFCKVSVNDMFCKVKSLPFDWSWYINKVIDFNKLNSILEKVTNDDHINLMYLFE